MPIDLRLLSGKLSNLRTQHQLTVDDVAAKTGIQVDRITAFETAVAEPNGDEVLILADLYSCDFRFLISNIRSTNLEKAEALFRLLGDELTKEDRLSISQFFHLCESEQWLQDILHVSKPNLPTLPDYIQRNTFYKEQGQQAARFLREHLQISDVGVVQDVFSVMRRLGVHVFRRKLANSNISGIYIYHPDIGNCILVNYDEDVFRQRFSGMHELGHAIFDGDMEVVVTGKGKWSPDKLREIRADNYAASFLCPPTLLAKISDVDSWHDEKAIAFCSKLMVNSRTLAIALFSNQFVNEDTYHLISKIKIPYALKQDPELVGLSGSTLTRKKHMLEKGLSHYYVKLCFDAYYHDLISLGKVCDLTLSNSEEIGEIADLFGIRL